MTIAKGGTLWVEQEVATRENPLVKEMRRQCVDRWAWDFQWATLGLLEGNQAAIETFRNGMVYYDDEKKTASPKPDFAIVELVRMLKEQKEQIEAQESKAIDIKGH